MKLSLGSRHISRKKNMNIPESSEEIAAPIESLLAQEDKPNRNKGKYYYINYCRKKTRKSVPLLFLCCAYGAQRKFAGFVLLKSIETLNFNLTRRKFHVLSLTISEVLTILS